mmetsp:Transcript_1455/g.3940  ORF Transcript_1455/g.3940 Transcript_1455/m.3940 type:complete len:212 (+) Transcript_1455:2156-2791(+)
MARHTGPRSSKQVTVNATRTDTWVWTCVRMACAMFDLQEPNCRLLAWSQMGRKRNTFMTRTTRPATAPNLADLVDLTAKVSCILTGSVAFTPKKYETSKTNVMAPKRSIQNRKLNGYESSVKRKPRNSRRKKRKPQVSTMSTSVCVGTSKMMERSTRNNATIKETTDNSVKVRLNTCLRMEATVEDSYHRFRVGGDTCHLPSLKEYGANGW